MADQAQPQPQAQAQAQPQAQDPDQDTQQGLRKVRGVLWELGLAERHLNPITGKSTCICKCKVDPNDPTIVCGKRLQLTQASTSSIRHHIKSQHPLDWAKVIKVEAQKAEKTAANKVNIIVLYLFIVFVKLSYFVSF